MSDLSEFKVCGNSPAVNMYSPSGDSRISACVYIVQYLCKWCVYVCNVCSVCVSGVLHCAGG